MDAETQIMDDICDGEQVRTDEGYIVTYAAIREAMNGESFTMSLTESEEINEVIECVNVGLDSRLQACYVEGRGDSFSGGSRGFTATEDAPNWKEGDKVIVAQTLECIVSIESFPVLLRRLFERDSSLASTIMGEILGFEYGVYVGRTD